MSNKRRGLLVVINLILTTGLITACTQSLSQSPLATPTLISTGLFVSPFPSVENPMAMIEEFAKQTAAAQTVAAGGPTSTPGTPQAIVTGGTAITVQVGGTVTPTATAGTPTNNVAIVCTAIAACPAGQSLTCTSGNCAGGCGMTCASNPIVVTPLPPGVRPASYTLQSGEFPYCLARRFDVDPDDLLSINGLTPGTVYMPGIILKIPQSGVFPGDRALAVHPSTYTVSSADQTIFGVACRYGDVDPAAVASANGLSVNSDLSVGQQLKIP